MKTNRKARKQKLGNKNNHISEFSPSLSVITFDVNVWRKTDCRMKMPFTKQFKFSDRGKLKLQRCKNIYHNNINLKNIGTTVLMPEKVYFRVKNITRDKDGHYTIIKGPVHQKDMRLLNGHSSEAPYTSPKLAELKGNRQTHSIGRNSTCSSQHRIELLY